MERNAAIQREFCGKVDIANIISRDITIVGNTDFNTHTNIGKNPCPIFPPQVSANYLAFITVKNKGSTFCLNFEIFYKLKLNCSADFIQQFIGIMIDDIVLHALQNGRYINILPCIFQVFAPPYPFTFSVFICKIGGFLGTTQPD